MNAYLIITCPRNIRSCIQSTRDHKYGDVQIYRDRAVAPTTMAVATVAYYSGPRGVTGLTYLTW